MRGLGILINDQFDLQIKPVRGTSGKIEQGLEIGNTLFQNQAVILLSHPGEITEQPRLGVGIEDALLDYDYPLWRRRIRLAMEADKQKVNNIDFSADKNLKIDAHY